VAGARHTGIPDRVSRAGRPTQTTSRQWVEAALQEIEAEGIKALAVQSVARRLHVSKGGFYHHFTNRRALIRAALDLWEERFVTDLASRFEAIPEPRERLEALLHHAAVELEPTIILRLMAAAADPDVASALARAAEGRLALLQRTFRDLGLPRGVAGRRAVLAYSAYLGLAQLRTQAPGSISTPAQVRAYVRDVEAALLHDV
jgi:AcrR family transcriptional regulator